MKQRAEKKIFIFYTRDMTYETNSRKQEIKKLHQKMFTLSSLRSGRWKFHEKFSRWGKLEVFLVTGSAGRNEKEKFQTQTQTRRHDSYVIRHLRMTSRITWKNKWVPWGTHVDVLYYTHFLCRQLGCLAFSLRFWPKIKQFLSICRASDWTSSFKTADVC